MTMLSSVSPYVHAPRPSHPPGVPSPVDAAWNLGHAHGAAGRKAFIPIEYEWFQSQAYIAGWRAGDAGRALASAPTPADEAWWSGFQLGINGVPANPPDDLPQVERDAFERGHDIGHARFVEDCERDYHEWLDRMDDAFADTAASIHEAEVAQVFGRRGFEVAGSEVAL